MNSATIMVTAVDEVLPGGSTAQRQVSELGAEQLTLVPNQAPARRKGWPAIPAGMVAATLYRPDRLGAGRSRLDGTKGFEKIDGARESSDEDAGLGRLVHTDKL